MVNGALLIDGYVIVGPSEESLSELNQSTVDILSSIAAERELTFELLNSFKEDSRVLQFKLTVRHRRLDCNNQKKVNAYIRRLHSEILSILGFFIPIAEMELAPDDLLRIERSIDEEEKEITTAAQRGTEASAPTPAWRSQSKALRQIRVPDFHI